MSPKLTGASSCNARESPEQWRGSVDGIKSVSIHRTVKVYERANTNKHTRFQRGVPESTGLAKCPVHRFSIRFLFLPTPFRPLLLSVMSVPAEDLWVFETRAIDEAQWSTREDLFKAHGYNFRPRLRKGWTPSWHTTGKSPLHSEDGEILRVLQSLNQLKLQLTTL